MSGLRRALWGIGIAGVGLAVVSVLLVLGSDHDDDKLPSLILGPLVGLAFLGTGLYAWWRRPDNRVGALMTVVGCVWFVSALAEADNPTVFTIGVWLNSLYIAALVHMLVAFPTGRVEGRLERAVVTGVWAAVLLIPLAIMVFRRDLDFPGDEPQHVLLLSDKPGLADVIDAVGNLAALALASGLAVILVRRWRQASAVARQALSPVLGTGAVFAVGLFVVFAFDLAGASNDTIQVVFLLPAACLVALPFAFLVGLGRARYTSAGAVSELVARLNASSPSLRDALAAALGDPSLRLVFRRADRDEWVDADGHRVELPPGATPVERDGEPIGAIVHDPSLSEQPDLVRAAANAAALALENERLAAELRARVAEVEESRSRLLTAGLAERRRLERDLHDGAQQRLVALALQLGLARARAGAGDSDGAARMLDDARNELSQALEELRELARGIHPAVLTDRGLVPALEALADRAPVPVAFDALPEERLPADVEAAAYFVVAESLTNVAKYAAAHEAHVRVMRRNGHAVVEVADDGVGGARPTGGTGLRGLADRLAALDGVLEVSSPPGSGTTVRATIPCAS
jgi:signal transduction histidine kinase